MLRGVEGVGERVDRPASSWFAFLMESTEETLKRFGIDEARGLHLSAHSVFYRCKRACSYLVSRQGGQKGMTLVTAAPTEATEQDVYLANLA
jgi:hypothetical protein